MYVCTKPLGALHIQGTSQSPWVIDNAPIQRRICKPLGASCTHTYAHFDLFPTDLEMLCKVLGCMTKPLRRGGFVYIEGDFIYTYLHIDRHFCLLPIGMGVLHQAPIHRVLYDAPRALHKQWGLHKPISVFFLQR